MEVAHKQTEVQPSNLSPTVTNTSTFWAHTHAHGWHTGCLESKAIFPGSPFSRPSPWQLTDSAHSTIPPRVSIASAVRGACVWATLTLNSAGSQGWLFKSVYAQISNTHHRHCEAQPIGASSGRGDFDRHICLYFPWFVFWVGIIDAFLFLAAYVQ